MNNVYTFIITLFSKITKRIWIKYNTIKFNLNNIEHGKKLSIYNKIYIKKHHGSSIIIGDNFTFTSGGNINPLCRNIKGCIVTSSPTAEIIIGHSVGISSASIWARKKIIIGNNVKIGGDVIIIDSNSHSLNYIERRIDLDDNSISSSPILIDDDVLIGTRCIILKGVHIGYRTIIGAGSVVVKDIPPNCIAAGNPCKVIKYIKESDG